MSGTLGYSSHGLCPWARRVHFRIFLWFSILCSYAAFIKHLLFLFSPGKVNILTSKQIRQWSWIQNNPLWETQNMKKNLSQKCDIALNCSIYTYRCHSYSCVGTELSHCMPFTPGSWCWFSSSDHFLHSECREICFCWQEAPNPTWLQNQSFWIPLKYVLSEYCHIRSGTT